jgi:hypothetical protein
MIFLEFYLFDNNINEVDYLMYDQKRSINIVDSFPDIFHKSEPSEKDIQVIKKFLNDNKYHKLILYHGTNAEFDIEHDGLLPTTSKRRNSLQSASGYVYLSIFPEMAKTFGEMAFPNKDINVYKIDVPIKDLKTDKDQLFNKRLYGNIQVGDSLAESLIIGHGARVKGKIPPYMIKRI